MKLRFLLSRIDKILAVLWFDKFITCYTRVATHKLAGNINKHICYFYFDLLVCIINWSQTDLRIQVLKIC